MNWKMRSKIYHMMTPEPGDDLRKETIIEEWDPKIIGTRACEYVHKQTTELHYPGKSYAVAMTFALLLTDHFGGEVRDYLSDPELLAGNDPYFIPFGKDPISDKIYEEIEEPFWYNIFTPFFNGTSENFQLTVKYFHKEFLLAEDTKIYLPADER